MLLIAVDQVAPLRGAFRNSRRQMTSSRECCSWTESVRRYRLIIWRGGKIPQDGGYNAELSSLLNQTGGWLPEYSCHPGMQLVVVLGVIGEGLLQRLPPHGEEARPASGQLDGQSLVPVAML